MYCVYCVTNKLNGKTYIGQHHTDNLNDNYMGSGKIILEACAKYGVENFSKSILAITEIKKVVNILEKYFIALYREEGKAEYNIANGGDGGSVLNFLSDEQIKNWKLKIGEKSKGHKLSEEAKRKISKAHTGKIVSKETRRKISEAGKGRVCSEESRIKRSLSLRGKKTQTNV